MNNKIILVVALITLFTLPNVKGQQDTIYYNISWKETVKDSAAFFRPPSKLEGDLYRIEDYYSSGQKQMSGLSKSNLKANWHGVVTWYNEDGSILQQATYEDNILNGKFISFLGDKKLVSIYEKGFFVNGSRNAKNRNTSFFTTLKNDTIKEIIYDKDINGIRYENYSVVKGPRFLSKYYDAEGKLIGERRIEEDGYYNGLEVFYYYSPMRVREVNYYRNNLKLASDFYYSNGNIRTKFQQKPEFKKTFFKENGEELGSATYQIDRDYLKAQNGKEFFFSYSYKAEKQGVIKTMRQYKDGALIKEELRYDSGNLKSVLTFVDKNKDLLINYDENGNEIARMQYKNYYPFNGTEIIGDKQATYKDGELINEINYYPKTKIKFNEKTQETEVYYDKSGNVLGTLELQYENKYGKPIKGKRFYTGYGIDISSIENYEEGFIKERTTFRRKQIADTVTKIFKRIEYYKAASFNKIREERFYSNGQKQSDITYEGYDKLEGKYYNEKGELIGEYNYKNKDGHLFTFFDDSDVIKLNQIDQKGELVSLKRFNYGPNYRNESIEPVLEEDIDVTCCAKTYTLEGEVFAEVVFKNRKPWEGTIYDKSSRVMYTLKDGKRNGRYQKYDYNKKSVIEEGQYINDKKEGLYNYFSYKGDLERSETFKEDKLNGNTIFYNEEGKAVATLIYKNDIPFEGKKVIKNGYRKQPTEETYANGTLVQRMSFDTNGKRITKFKEGKESETIAYHLTTNKKRLSYKVKDYFIDGDVIRYDEKGNEQNRATFVNKKLKSGTVYLTSADTYDKKVRYIVLSIEGKKLSVVFRDKNDTVIFSAVENIEPGFKSNYLNKLNIYTDNIRPDTLY